MDFAPTGAARGGDRVKLSRLGSFRATPTTRQICRVGGGDGEEAGLGRLGSIRVDWGRLCHLLHRSGGAHARVGRRRPFFFLPCPPRDRKSAGRYCATPSGFDLILGRHRGLRMLRTLTPGYICVAPFGAWRYSTARPADARGRVLSDASASLPMRAYSRVAVSWERTEDALKYQPLVALRFRFGLAFHIWQFDSLKTGGSSEHRGGKIWYNMPQYARL